MVDSWIRPGGIPCTRDQRPERYRYNIIWQFFSRGEIWFAPLFWSFRPFARFTIPREKNCHNIETRIFMGCTQQSRIPLFFPRESLGKKKGCVRFFSLGPPLEKTRRSLARPIKTPDSFCSNEFAAFFKMVPAWGKTSPPEFTSLVMWSTKTP